MTEQQLQKKIIDYIEASGGWTIKTITTNKRGCPDILACINGKFVAIEVKRPGQLKAVSPLQKHTIERINDAGGFAFATDNLEYTQNVLQSIIHIA